MRVWTIQPIEVWEQLQVHGKVAVDESRLPCSGYVPECYRWLVQAIKRRQPEWTAALPWWVYCEKPDLRQSRHYRPAESRECRIELEPANSIVQTYPCSAWDIVYGRNYLALTQREADDWERRLREAVPDEDVWPLPEPWRSELHASWERLFDERLPLRPWRTGCIGDEGFREGVVDYLRLEDVRKVTLFTGAERRRLRQGQV